jgi:hypothetical protein
MHACKQQTQREPAQHKSTASDHVAADENDDFFPATGLMQHPYLSRSNLNGFDRSSVARFTGFLDGRWHK